MRASLFTLGCKLNQFETTYLMQLFEDMGYDIVPFPSESDVYLINTCTVTAKSEVHSRQAVRRATRGNSKGIVIVTGCAAQVNPEAFGAIPGVGLILGNQEKMDMPFFLDAHKKGKCRKMNVRPYGVCLKDKRVALQPLQIKKFLDYTRAFIKVQEGCDSHCTYCIVPDARGPARSVPIENVVAQADILWAAGYREIVLTGIHLGQYGKDLVPERRLYKLLDRILEKIGRNRLRLSSIEPNEINNRILDRVGAYERLCPHFHIPLQSGSKRVLSLMGRGYAPEDYMDIIHDIIQKNPIVSIGADVMVGFPGETEEDFEATYRIIQGLPLAYLHVFVFSPRPGTSAASMPNHVDSSVKRKRGRLLREMAQRKKNAFRYRFLKKELEALVLNQIGQGPDCRVALTGNYIPVYVKARHREVNRLALVEIEKVEKRGTWGRITSLLN